MVLPQHSPGDQRLHPCTFFSHRLTPAECNYNMGNRELLAVKLALEEWRHLLEGAEQPFVVWTDHHNFEYLQTTKRLNSRQARWAIFFGRFRFKLSYRPGSRNLKPDALSRQFTSESCPPEVVTILPPSCRVAVMTGKLERHIRSAQAAQPNLRPNPNHCLFVPNPVRPQALQWAHSSLLTCHLGTHRTLAFLRQHFWWPAIAKDASAFVQACTTCTRSKASHKPPPGLLHPIPVPGRPWSHIGVDFVTGMTVTPPS